MSVTALSEKGQAFLDAWKLHDRSALRISNAAYVALKNQKPYFTSALALRDETALFVETKKDFADEINVNAVLLMRSLHELRRDGVEHEKAIRLVLDYLERINDSA